MSAGCLHLRRMNYLSTLLRSLIFPSFNKPLGSNKILFHIYVKLNSSLSTRILQKSINVYQFECPLKDCISDKNVNMYVAFTTTMLTRSLRSM